MSLRKAHRNIKLRLFVGFVNRFLSFMLAPLATIYFASQFGVARTGPMLAAVVIATMACTFLGGYLSDERGRRWTLLVSESGVSIAYIGMFASIAVWHSAWAMFVFFLLNSCMGGLGFPANDAVMIDVAAPELRATIYTANYWSMNFAFACGGAVGGFFYNNHFALLLELGAGLSLLVFVVTWRALLETRPAVTMTRSPGTGKVRAAVTDYVTALRDRPFQRLVVGAILITAIELQLTYYIAIRMAHQFPAQSLWPASHTLITGVAMLGILRTLNTVLVVIIAPVVKKVFGRLPEESRINFGVTIFTAGFAVLTVSNSGWVLIAASVVYSVGELMNVPARQSLMADIVDPRARSKYMAVYGLRPRASGLIASFALSFAVIIPPAGMAGLLVALGAGSIVLLQSPIRSRPALVERYEALLRDAAASPAPEVAR